VLVGAEGRAFPTLQADMPHETLSRDPTASDAKAEELCQIIQIHLLRPLLSSRLHAIHNRRGKVGWG